MAAAVPDVDDAAVVEGDVAGHAGRAQRKRDGVAGAKMLLEQRSQRQIGQDVAAVDEEGFIRQEAFGVLDPATGFEQDRFVHQSQRPAAIAVFA